MAVMVTGIGFVGGYVVRDLLEAGEDVVMYGLFGGTDEGSGTPRDLLFLEDLLSGVETAGSMVAVTGDICDYDHLLRTIEERNVTSIIHLASLISASSQANVPLAVQVNLAGSVNIFEAAVEKNLERVVWASSINVYGPRSVLEDGTVSNISLPDPSTVYGAGKAFLETVAKSYHQDHGLSVVGLRLSRVYGYGEHVKAGRGGGSSWLTPLLQGPATGESATIPFGDRTIDLQYIEDVSAAFVTALHSRGGAGNTYVTHGDYRPVVDAFEFVNRLVPDADMILVDGPPAGLKPGSQTNWAYKFDASGTERDLGIKSRFSMEEGLLRTIQRYRGRAGLTPVQAL